MPCPTRASQHPPIPSPEKGYSVVPVWSLAPGNLSPLGQKSFDPHLSFVISSHKLASAERSAKLFMVACNRRKRISSVASMSGLEHPHTWGRHLQLCLGISPQPVDGLLMESTQMRTQAVSICLTLTCFYAMQIQWQMVKVSLTMLWCLKND